MIKLFDFEKLPDETYSEFDERLLECWLNWVKEYHKGISTGKNRRVPENFTLWVEAK